MMTNVHATKIDVAAGGVVGEDRSNGKRIVTAPRRDDDRPSVGESVAILTLVLIGIATAAACALFPSALRAAAWAAAIVLAFLMLRFCHVLN